MTNSALSLMNNDEMELGLFGESKDQVRYVAKLLHYFQPGVPSSMYFSLSGSLVKRYGFFPAVLSALSAKEVIESSAFAKLTYLAKAYSASLKNYKSTDASKKEVDTILKREVRTKVKAPDFFELLFDGKITREQYELASKDPLYAAELEAVARA